ncbi:MAG: 1-phosphofructokinase [Solobacterium sp.]|nr:1-phosphofructokinase [Solobacterium sp.]
MISTVTFNPSLDYIVRVDHFRAGQINRTAEELLLPGGKGINVSIVLKTLGIESCALGFSAGFTGQEIRRLLKEAGIGTDFIEVPEGFSRINLKMRSDEETEINGAGPKIREEDLNALIQKLDALKKEDILVLSGSIPSGIPKSVYRDILKRLEGSGVEVIVDAEGELLKNTIPYHPFLIKPNHHELGMLLGREITSKDEAVTAAKSLQEIGARNVLVSMAGDGAVFVSETGEVFQSEAPKGTVRNSVGAGDSMVAGFLAGYLRNHDYREAFRLGLCAGSASAFSDGLASKEDIEALLNRFE